MTDAAHQPQAPAPATPTDRPRVDSDLATRLRISLARLRRLSRDSTGDAALTPSQLAVLSGVEASPGLRIGDLASSQALAAPSATRIVQGLVDLGLLRREVDPADKRACLITITDEGVQALATVRAGTTDLITTRLRTLSNDDRSSLLAAIDALERLAGVEPAYQPL